jgi:hypothetical protein
MTEHIWLYAVCMLSASVCILSEYSVHTGTMAKHMLLCAVCMLSTSQLTHSTLDNMHTLNLTTCTPYTDNMHTVSYSMHTAESNMRSAH